MTCDRIRWKGSHNPTVAPDSHFCRVLVPSTSEVPHVSSTTDHHLRVSTSADPFGSHTVHLYPVPECQTTLTLWWWICDTLRNGDGGHETSPVGQTYLGGEGAPESLFSSRVPISNPKTESTESALCLSLSSTTRTRGLRHVGFNCTLPR